MKEFIKYIEKNKKIRIFYKIIFCDGIVVYLLGTLVIIVIVMTFKTNISLGILTTIFSICSIVSVYIFQRGLKKNNNVLILSTIMMVISVLSILVSINKITVVLYNLCRSVFLILLINNAEEKRYTIINNSKDINKDYLDEHQVASEISLNISRIIGYGLLFVVSIFNNMIYFKLLLVIITIVIVLYSKLMINLNKD